MAPGANPGSPCLWWGRRAWWKESLGAGAPKDLPVFTWPVSQPEISRVRIAMAGAQTTKQSGRVSRKEADDRGSVGSAVSGPGSFV